MELLRSLIFVPGNRSNMLEKARDFPADVIVADLEDSVPPGEKVAARDMVQQVGPNLCARGQKLMVRLQLAGYRADQGMSWMLSLGRTCMGSAWGRWSRLSIYGR